MTHKKDHGTLGRFCLKVSQRKAVVGVIGLGYVGLPLAMEFVRAGFQVVGVDLNPARIHQLREGCPHLPEVSAEQLHEAIQGQRLMLTQDYRPLCLADAVMICVPTPVTAAGDPDLTYIRSATQRLSSVLTAGTLVSLESTTYPGTTEELVEPLLEAAGLQVGKDLFLCYSPERVDPANRQYQIRNTPKVVAGRTAACQAAGLFLYSTVVDRVVPVSSTRTAEMVKLLENIYRSVNIALVNEMAVLSAGLGVDIWEVISAAATKPFGFMPFYPGPGIGGHCIPVDPLYLQWRLRNGGLRSRFIDLATEINGAMPSYVAGVADSLLRARDKQLRHASVLLLGISYKRDVGDVRESPALQLLELLRERCYRIAYHDPLVPECRDSRGNALKSVPLTEPALQESDCVILATDHSCFPYEWIAQHAPLILDTRNAFETIRMPSIHRLGAPSCPLPANQGIVPPARDAAALSGIQTSLQQM